MTIWVIIFFFFKYSSRFFPPLLLLLVSQGGNQHSLQAGLVQKDELCQHGSQRNGTVPELFSSRRMHCSIIILGFSSDVCVTWFRLSGFVTPAVKSSRLLVPRVSHLFKDSHRNILWWILHMRASLMLISCCAARLTYFDFPRKLASGFESLEGATHRLVSGFRLLFAKFWLLNAFHPRLI